MLPGPCPGAGLEELARGQAGVGKLVGEIPEASLGPLTGLFLFSPCPRRAVPPPPPPSATGTVGVDVPPASGRDQVGGQWGPGLAVDQKARKAMRPVGLRAPTVMAADNRPILFQFPPWAPLRQEGVTMRVLSPPRLL